MYLFDVFRRDDIPSAAMALSFAAMAFLFAVMAFSSAVMASSFAVMAFPSAVMASPFAVMAKSLPRWHRRDGVAECATSTHSANKNHTGTAS